MTSTPKPTGSALGVVDQHVPSLDEIFVARVGSRSLAMAEVEVEN